VRPEVFDGDPIFRTATPDLSHLLLSSCARLTADATESCEAGKVSVFEWAAGHLRLVSLIPTSSEPLCGGSAPACQPAAAAGQTSGVGNASSQVRNAISTDGSRVVFETVGESIGHRLFLRDLAREETLQLDAAAAGCPEPACKSGGGLFQIASADGSRVFFTDARPLTQGSAKGTPDLYMCQIEETPAGLACDLTDLSANALDPSEQAAVLGTVLGAATDGSSVYFVANGALTQGEGAVSGTCGEAAQQSCNLYHYDLLTGETRLVAVLSGADFHDWVPNGFDLGELAARVSPNGRYLAFMSQHSLTGYDNRDAATGARDQEVFLYDSGTPLSEALRCASCNPSGARPRGVLDTGDFPGLLVDRPGLWSGGSNPSNRQTLAANIPGWTKVDDGHALYQSRYLSNSGRLFFNAADSLVPSDTNATFDVYQFEFPQGPGQPESNTCTASTPGYNPKSGGCVSLISSGESPQESAFMDASENGDDVFFLTASRLTPRDVDGALDLYDARSGGGEPEVVKPVECSGDACQQPAVPPNHPTPGTALLNGPGNVLECPKGKVKQKGKCVAKKAHKKKHNKKGKKHAKKRPGSHNRGGGK
jgi:hypothetical protein